MEDKLEKILEQFQNDAATDDLSNDWDGQLKEATQAITQLLDEARIAELEELKNYMTLYPVDPKWEHAVPEVQIDLAIHELQAKLNKG